MSSFSKKSLDQLDTCHPDLQLLFKTVVKSYNCSILCGHRGKEDQDEAFRSGKSKVQWPNSKHNELPSRAVDVAPWPIDWSDTKRFYHFVGYVMAVAEGLGINIRSGADWDGDLDFKDQSFNDVVHFELDDDGGGKLVGVA